MGEVETIANVAMACTELMQTAFRFGNRNKQITVIAFNEKQEVGTTL